MLNLAVGGITSSTFGRGNGGTIDLEVNGLMELLNEGSVLNSTFSKGNAGDVKIHAGDLRMDTLAYINNEANSQDINMAGNGGKIDVAVDNFVEILNGSQISGSTTSAGDAGNITITTGDLTIDSLGLNLVTGIFSQSINPDSTGTAGRVEVNVDGKLEILGNKAQISSGTWSAGAGGEIFVKSDSLSIDAQSGSGGITSSTFGRGNGGTIDLEVNGLMELLNEGSVLNSTFSKGNAGDVKIHAGDLRMDTLAYINNEANSQDINMAGNGGKIDVAVDNFVEILNGSQISGSTTSAGDAGNITITTGDLTIESQSSNQVTGIFSQSINLDSTGNAGRVEVNVDGKLKILGNKAQISSGTWSAGAGGEIFVKSDSLSIDAQSGLGGITSATSGRGDAGKIDVAVENLLEILNGSQISGCTTSAGDAGNITITTGDLTIESQSSNQVTGIFSQSNSPDSTGNGGRVEVDVREHLEIMGTQAYISSATFGQGSGGEVFVQSDSLLLNGNNGEGGIRSATAGSGDGGIVDVYVSGLMEILNGGIVANSTFSKGNAGNVTIRAGALSMDRQDSDFITGIFSDANSGSTGHAGNVDVTATGCFNILNGSEVSSGTWSDGDAGIVAVKAENLTINSQGSAIVTGIFSQSNPESTGNAGRVEVDVGGDLEIMGDLAYISGATFGQGSGGEVFVQSDSLLINGNDGEGGIRSVTAGSGAGGIVDVDVSGLMAILNGGIVANSTFSKGNAGNVTIRAGALSMDRQNSDFITGIFSDAMSGSTGHAGNVDVTATGCFNILNGSNVSSSTWADGDAGKIIIRSVDLTIDSLSSGLNPSFVTGIFSQSNNSESTGNAGCVEVEVDGNLKILGNNAQIASGTWSAGTGGEIFVKSDSLSIDAQSGSGGITSSTLGRGDGGTIDLEVNGLMELLNGGLVLNNARFSKGNAGDVKIHVGDLRMDTLAYINNEANSQDINMTGNGGRIDVAVENLVEILNGSQISGSTNSAGDAGNITITTGDLTIDSLGSNLVTGIFSQSINPDLTGKAGRVEVNVDGKFKIIGNNTGISSATYSYGTSGEIFVKSDSLSVDAQSGSGGITTATSGRGDGGIVDIDIIGLMEILNGANISSSTKSEGDAGEVNIKAGTLNIDGQGNQTGIQSLASINSNGYVGNVSITADQMTILNNGQVSIAGLQPVYDNLFGAIPERAIHIDTHTLYLDQDAGITAESKGNMPAAAIELNTGKLVVAHGSSITTSAEEADGGPITIQSDTLVLRDALITTSVTGTSGNGGDIVLTGRENDPSDAIVFSAGFVQANTEAVAAHGGDVFINARAVIAEGDELLVGGEERQIFEPGNGLNVIQAAAPGGEQGTIEITAPELDISGSLVHTAVGFIQPVRLATDPCSVAGGQGMNSLVLMGSGGIPDVSQESLDIFWDKERMDRLLEENF